MSRHVLVPVRWANAPKEERYGGRCKLCGWTADHVASSHGVQDQFRKHLQEIERVHANLRRTEPGVDEMKAYYEGKAADTRLSKGERDLWQMLADELKPRWRPGDRTPYEDDKPLF